MSELIREKIATHDQQLSWTVIGAYGAPGIGASLITWMAVGVIGFYSAMTIFVVPHLSLGPELTSLYHERSRLYGLRHAAYTIGSIWHWAACTY